MNPSIAGFIAKVFALSTLVGLVIKYGAPLVAPPPSLGLCLVLLVVPAGGMAILFWRQSS
jgi:uncharacterized membrane protein YccC